MSGEDSENWITEATRRDLFETISGMNLSWSGRLPESEFLGRLYELENLPSSDRRHQNAGEDIAHHRDWDCDWADDWVFYDDRFRLLDCGDEELLRFFALMLHPTVRPNPNEAARIAKALSRGLSRNGFELVPAAYESGRPTYRGRRIEGSNASSDVRQLPPLPTPVATVCGQVVGLYYYRHAAIEALFYENGALGEPPEGSCVTKATEWLKRCAGDRAIDEYEVLGGVLAELMEADPEHEPNPEETRKSQRRVRKTLKKHSLEYRVGGRIQRIGDAPPMRRLRELLAGRDLDSVEAEFERALDNLESDPPAALTAACAILESLFKVYIEDHGLSEPSKKTLKPLWKTVQMDLNLEPKSHADEDLRRILSGLASVVDGIAALRTHAGSAHGRGRLRYRIKPRHARLAVHSAHLLTCFVLETWGEKAK